MKATAVRRGVARLIVAVLTLAVGIFGVVLTPGRGQAQAGAITFGDPAYVPLQPARLMDTRSGLGAPAAKIGPGGSVTLQVTGHGGVPAAGVNAVVLNVTATNPTAASFITVYPPGATRPLASNLNVVTGQTIPNLVVVKLSDTGQVTLYNNAGTVDLIVDVSGYFDQPVAVSVQPAPSTDVVPATQVAAVSSDPTGDGTVTFTGSAPPIGDVVFVAPATNTGDGLLGRVDALSTDGQGRAVATTSPVRLADAF